jgi:L-ascorbate metabolism protein UlaG (beta-lactamase superfamily)
MTDSKSAFSVTYSGGPTAILELAGLRLLTDPTFDAPGRTYEIPRVGAKTTKLAGPALAPEALGAIDAVLLSHDEHADNLDEGGRALLSRVPVIFTTPDGALRLGGKARGLAAWEDIVIGAGALRITAVPGRHGPEGCEPLLGHVTGFVLQTLQGPSLTVYVTGDTVFYERVEEIGRRFSVDVMVANLGRVEQPGGPRFTMSAEDAGKASLSVRASRIVPLHYEGWAHFTQGREEAARAFAAAGLTDRVRWLEPGVPTVVA